MSGGLAIALTMAAFCAWAGGLVVFVWGRLAPGDAVRIMWGRFAVACALFTAAAWVEHRWLGWWVCVSSTGYCAFQWWHSGGDDEWRRRRRRLKAWARSRIPRPRVVVVRPVGGAV